MIDLLNPKVPSLVDCIGVGVEYLSQKKGTKIEKMAAYVNFISPPLDGFVHLTSPPHVGFARIGQILYHLN